MGKKKHKPPDNLPGQIIVTDTLDLHGIFPEQVTGIVNDFLYNGQELGLEQVRIIHGKGKSRLKWEVVQVLKGHDLVDGFKDAPPELGGWGSTLVVLKSQEPVE